MPNVGRKKFKYTKKGKDEAEAYAKKHGRKVNRKKNPGYTFESTVNSVLNKLNEFVSSERVKRAEGARANQMDVPREGETPETRWLRYQRRAKEAEAARANPTTRRIAAQMARRGTPTGRRGTPRR